MLALLGQGTLCLACVAMLIFTFMGGGTVTAHNEDSDCQGIEEHIQGCVYGGRARIQTQAILPPYLEHATSLLGFLSPVLTGSPCLKCRNWILCTLPSYLQEP